MNFTLPGSHPADRQPPSLPGYEVDDHRVQGEQTQTHASLRKTFPGTPGCLREGGQRNQEETRATQDGGSQQSLCPLPLVVVPLYPPTPGLERKKWYPFTVTMGSILCCGVIYNSSMHVKPLSPIVFRHFFKLCVWYKINCDNYTKPIVY